MRTSGATQVADLAQTFAQMGHSTTVVLPNSAQAEDLIVSKRQGCDILSVRALQTKDVNYLYRTLAEFINPLLMWHRLQKSKCLEGKKIEGVVWYSPSIFWGPLVKRIKEKFSCKAYLILRDIFPDWAYDLGLLNNPFAYKILKWAEAYQYAQANCIGIQSPNNEIYFRNKNPNIKATLEVLWNWVAADFQNTQCSININSSSLAGRKIAVYAGNMGVAQNMDTLIQLAIDHQGVTEWGFVFVGRGSEQVRLKEVAVKHQLANIIFFDEIPSDQIPALYAQCDIGMLSLDTRHTTHNIPGKFVTYLQAGLPVLAIVNSGNDLIELITKNQVGVVISNNHSEEISKAFSHLIDQLKNDSQIQGRCQTLAQELFSPTRAAQQIIHQLSN
jgi:glycosyltransferase involved in cell wall biosynthesis